MEWLHKLSRLFERHPELVYATGIIVLFATLSFGHLIHHYLSNRRAASGSKKTVFHQDLPENVEMHQAAIPSVAVSMADDGSSGLKTVREDLPIHMPVVLEETTIEQVIVTAARANDPASTDLFGRGARQEFSAPDPVPDVLSVEMAERSLAAFESQIDTPEVQLNTSLLPATPGYDAAVDRTEAQISDTKPDPVTEQTVVPQHTPPDPVEVVRIGYQPHLYQHRHAHDYPFVSMPKPHSVIRLPYKESSRVRGQLEAVFQQMLADAFPGCLVSGELCVPPGTGSRPFYPDIVLAIEESNIYIDIEIDEPYAAHKRVPMHCRGDDEPRDAWFTSRGWIVIRFSEKQIAGEAGNCVAFVAKVLRTVLPHFTMPAQSDHLPLPTTEPQWTQSQAHSWQKHRYRENYLGIQTFSRIELPALLKELTLTFRDIATEHLVVANEPYEPKPPVLHHFNRQHLHPRDMRIRRVRSRWIFEVDGFPVKQISGIINSYFPPLPEYHPPEQTNDLPKEQMGEEGYQRQQTRGELQAEKKLIDDIEHYFLSGTVASTKEFAYFRHFIEAYNWLKPYRSQWYVFDELHHVGGVIDLVLQNEAGSFDLITWKRTNVLVDHFGRPFLKNEKELSGVGPFRHLHDTVYNRCCLEQNTYRYILENRYGLSVRNMDIVVLHPDMEDFAKVKVQPMMPEAELLISPDY